MSADPAGSELDELFGEGGGAPRSRRGLVWALLACGLLSAVLGLGCTPIPGAILVLLALYVSEKELARVETGYLPVDERAGLRRLRAYTIVGVIGVVVVFVVQLVLLQSGVYEAPWYQALEIVSELRAPFVSDPSADPSAPPDPNAPAPDPDAPAAPPGP